MEVNSVCQELCNLQSFKNIVERSVKHFSELETHNKYLSFSQLSDKSNHYQAELNKSKLEIIKLRSRINKIGETVSMHQRFIMHIANSDIPRLKELVQVALRNNRGISYIVDKVVQAVKGVYLARPSDKDKDLALLILEFGGPALLDICHKANALPSVSTGYRMRKKSKIIHSQTMNEVCEKD